MNDIDSSLKNTNDLILPHILLFGQASLDISTNTLILNMQQENTSYQQTDFKKVFF